MRDVSTVTATGHTRRRPEGAPPVGTRIPQQDLSHEVSPSAATGASTGEAPPDEPLSTSRGTYLVPATQETWRCVGARAPSCVGIRRITIRVPPDGPAPPFRLP
ncbi:hypothetical protein GCM10015535_25370 [Streptomyces gelaticus]|uniref:Uncharacterized protein n=1 Tax=Streptomyces gelaticus TaxID=285446 RepID=A0ABQ2W025_9ACTN|nr:hypothetical protein GCM10015535_25370 [Streptomyces gelaticus]